MTPFAWRASVDTGQKLAAQPSFSCETDFVISLHRRKTDSPQNDI